MNMLKPNMRACDSALIDTATSELKTSDEISELEVHHLGIIKVKNLTLPEPWLNGTGL